MARYGLEIKHMKLIEELNYQFDFETIKKETSDLLDNPLSNRFSGISIQHRLDIVPPWDQVDGLDRLQLYGNCNEKDFSVINTKVKNTEFEKIIQDFNLVRSRIMVLKEKHNYSIHQDLSWRLHIPIKTNSNCLFYFPDHKEHFHLENGKIYKVNTTERHTFINAGWDDRIHFIGCLYDKLIFR